VKSDVLTDFLREISCFLSTHLTQKQWVLLKFIQQVLRNKKQDEFYSLTMNALTEELRKRSKFPISTIKWNLRKMRESGLLGYDSQNGRSKKVFLTRLGKFVVSNPNFC
jgi:hypothetical protein